MKRLLVGFASTALLVLPHTSRAADPKPARSAVNRPTAGSNAKAGDSLTQLGSPSLGAAQKAALGLRLLDVELARPAPLTLAAPGNAKTHDTGLAQIVRKMAEGGAELAAVRSAWSAEKEGTRKDCLMLCLALGGEADVQRQAGAYLTNPRNPMRLRELAARSLGVLGAKTRNARLGETLWQAMRKDTQVQVVSVPDADPKKPARQVPAFPVQVAAAAAIRKMEAAGMQFPSYVTRSAERAEAYQEALERHLKKQP